MIRASLSERVGKFWTRLTPSQMIAFSFVTVIFVGGLVLSMPVCHEVGARISPLDAFFTSASAVCVTGLVTVTTATSWNLLGKTVLMALIQIGGLGFTSLFMLVMVQMGRKVTLKDRLNLQASFNVNSISGVVRMLLFVVRATFITEGIGAALLTAFFASRMPFYRALFYGLFHAVSAFCNAGFDLIGDDGFIAFSDSPYLILTVSALIILGGVGFPVWYDCRKKIKDQLAPGVKHPTRLSVSTKLALIVTGALILFGTAFFFLSESHNPKTLGSMPLGEKVLNAFFQSVTLRTAGFFTISQGALTDASRLIGSILMLLGGSPGGTAGGMKTVTVAVLLLSVWSALRGNERLNVFGRSIPFRTLQKALTVAVATLFLWFISASVLSFTEARNVFHPTVTDILYETASALGTVGVTTGMTPFLSPAGKILIMLCMYIGRIGPLTLAFSLVHKTYNIDERILYPPEDVLIG